MILSFSLGIRSGTIWFLGCFKFVLKTSIVWGPDPPNVVGLIKTHIWILFYFNNDILETISDLCFKLENKKKMFSSFSWQKWKRGKQLRPKIKNYTISICVNFHTSTLSKILVIDLLWVLLTLGIHWAHLPNKNKTRGPRYLGGKSGHPALLTTNHAHRLDSQPHHLRLNTTRPPPTPENIMKGYSQAT